jgi:hypothetical protein
MSQASRPRGFAAGEIEQSCALTNNATETRWAQNAMRACAAICFPSGRVRFVDSNGVARGTLCKARRFYNLATFHGALPRALQNSAVSFQIGARHERTAL